MPETTPTYDLMVLLSTSVDEDRRAKILADVEAAISGAGGSIVHNGDWGIRPMTYRIQHQQEAEYHLLQFTGPPALLEELNRSLGIADGVLRSRIIKVLPGTPPPPRPTPVAAHAPAPTPTPAEAPEAAPPAESPGGAEISAEPEPPGAAEPVAEPEVPAEPEPVAEPEVAAEPEVPAEPESPAEAEAPAEPGK